MTSFTSKMIASSSCWKSGVRLPVSSSNFPNDALGFIV